MELSSSCIKKFLIFSYISGIRLHPPPPPKKKIIFQETETLKSFLYFRNVTFKAQAPEKAKKIHPEKNLPYFCKWNPALFSPSSKNKKIHPENSPKTSYIF